MKTYAIDFYDKFECIGGSCPYTCCKGWQIAVDEDTYKSYQKLPFPKNLLYRLMTGKKDGIRSIRKINSVCPYYTAEGLCRFHKAANEQLMPKVCRQYPRTSICFGKYNEVTLELSCIRAAELFIENIGRHGFYEHTDGIEANWTIGNDSQTFLKFLQADRKKLLSYIWDDSHDMLWEKICHIYEYIYVVNQYLSKDEIEAAATLSLPVSTSEIKDWNIPKISDGTQGIPFYPIWFLNEIIYEKILNNTLKKKNRYLYDIIREYEKLFGDLSVQEADSFFVDKYEQMVNEQPEIEQFFQAYLSYLIQQMYCKAYEDYYVLGQILLIIVDCQMTMLFMLVKYMYSNRLEPADMAAVLANTERAIRHNLILNDDILYKIRQSFFK